MTNVPPPAPVWDAQPSGSAATRYGGFWIRVVAYFIDAIVMSFVGSAAGFAIGFVLALGGVDHDAVTATGYAISVIVGWLYFALMESSARGATLGKMALNLRVVTVEGNRLSFANATGRYFAKFISATLACVGFLMVAFTEQKRGLHDLMASTLVVKVR